MALTAPFKRQVTTHQVDQADIKPGIWFWLRRFKPLCQLLPLVPLRVDGSIGRKGSVVDQQARRHILRTSDIAHEAPLERRGDGADDELVANNSHCRYLLEHQLKLHRHTRADVTDAILQFRLGGVVGNPERFRRSAAYEAVAIALTVAVDLDVMRADAVGGIFTHLAPLHWAEAQGEAMTTGNPSTVATRFVFAPHQPYAHETMRHQCSIFELSRTSDGKRVLKLRLIAGGELDDGRFARFDFDKADFGILAITFEVVVINIDDVATGKHSRRSKLAVFVGGGVFVIGCAFLTRQTVVQTERKLRHRLPRLRMPNDARNTSARNHFQVKRLDSFLPLFKGNGDVPPRYAVGRDVRLVLEDDPHEPRRWLPAATRHQSAR